MQKYYEQIIKMSALDVLLLFVNKPIDQYLALTFPTEIGDQLINRNDQLNRDTHNIMITAKS